MLLNIIWRGYRDYLVSIINTLKYWIVFSVLLFIAGFALSLVNMFNIHLYIEIALGELINKFSGLRGLELFLGIFLQNAKASLIIIFSGVLFSIFPVVATLLNGAMIGFMLVNIDRYSDLTLNEGLLRLIPHGIFEIPAVILAISLGIKLGSWAYQSEKIAFIKLNIVRSVQAYLFIIIPLLLIAGVIETLGIEQLRR